VIKWKASYDFASPDQRHFAAKKIIERFISDTAERQVNLDFVAVCEIQLKIQNPIVEKTLFDLAETKIRDVLQFDAIPRFNSRLYKKRSSLSNTAPKYRLLGEKSVRRRSRSVEVAI